MKPNLLIFALLCSMPSAARVWQLTAPATPKTVTEGALRLGGTSPTGRIDVNSYYMSIDGQPAIPVTGEFHYSRYPAAQWEKEIVKMRAGGITVLPTYVFWNLHEEHEGRFDWTGDLDLRRFVQLCQKHDMKVIARIGPFAHGEMRNGGLPDWLLARGVDVRSDDAAYMAYVERFYTEIARQLDGLFYKDGGPIIGVQIENEHQHSAAPWGVNYPGEASDYTSASYDKDITRIGVSVQDAQITTAQRGERHMLNLKRLAQRLGMQAPLYTVTGWGMAAVIDGEALPVTAAYTYPFWDEPKPSPFCLFTDLHANPDYSPVRYEPTSVPSFCAEMGVGMQHTYLRRPLVTAQAAEALMVRTLGSGSNGIGYYMYHGGSTPLRSDGVGSFADEPMGMPKISYDYQAPLGEYGLEHPSYRTLRLLHHFLADFGDRLAPMETVLPEGWQNVTPTCRDTLRYAMRVKDDRGFVFLVNFQDHDPARHDFEDVELQLNLRGETLTFPRFTLPKDVNCILPFNLDIEGAQLKCATAQLLLRLDDGGTPHYFFFAPQGISPVYRFDAATVKGKSTFTPQPGLKSTFTVRAANGKRIKITTLTREQAVNACRVGNGLVITDATVLPDGNAFVLEQMADTTFRYTSYVPSRGFRETVAAVPAVQPKYDWKQSTPINVSVNFDPKANAAAQVSEYFLRLDYVADVAFAFADGRMVGDNFWAGSPWNIALDRFAGKLSHGPMTFYLRPLRPGLPFLIDVPQDALSALDNGPVCTVRDVQIVPQYRFVVEQM